MASTKAYAVFVDIPGMPFHIPDPVKENQPMPFYDLPLPIEQIMEDVDAVIVTHLHPDHIDISPIDGTVGAPLDKKSRSIVKMKKMPLYWKSPDFPELPCFR